MGKGDEQKCKNKAVTVPVRAKETSMKLLHINIRSIMNKINALEIEIDSYENNIDILCLSETWLKTEQVNLAVINQYYMATCFNRTLRKGGGTCIYLNKNSNIDYIVRSDINLLAEESEFEICAIEIRVPCKIIIVACYRPPNANANQCSKKFFSMLSMLLDKSISHDKRFLLCGDLNLDTNQNNKISHMLEEVVMTGNCKILNIGPTRIANIKGNITATTIDHVITNTESVTLLHNIDLGLSDHLAQVVSIDKDTVDKQSQKKKYVYKRCFKKDQVEQFLMMLQETNWEPVIKLNDVNLAFNLFMYKFNKYFNQAFPIRKIKICSRQRSKPWYTIELLELSKEVKNKYQKYRMSGNDTSKERYTKLLMRYMREIDLAINKYNSEIIKKAANKSKAAWSIIHKNNSSAVSHKDADITLKHKGNEVTSTKEVAELFNCFFKESVTRLVSSCTNNTQVKNNTAVSQEMDKLTTSKQNIFLFPLLRNEYYKIMNKITKKKSAGYDEIPANILKNAAVILSVPLIYIINLSFETGVFPEVLKKSVICPIYKSGNKELMENYRPLALQSVFSKLFENAFCSRLTSFMEKNKLLNECQHGFRKNRSTTTAIMQFVNKLMSTADTGQKAYGIFYDYSKAFDMVSQSKLLEKLNHLGVRGVANDWIRSYLNKRSQVVKINSKHGAIKSKEISIDVGIPQGSTVAPLLFIIYTNDLYNSITCGDLTTFADDTTHLVGGVKDEIEISSKTAVRQMENWSIKNELLLNNKKTVIINFKLKKSKEEDESNPLIYLNGRSIQVKNETKFLGLIIDNKLKWDAHIKQVAIKVAAGCYLVKRILAVCNFQTAKAVYHSYVHSRLIYGIILWGHSKQIKTLFTLQKRAIRNLANASYNPVTTGVFYKDSCKKLFFKFNILPLPCVYIFSIIMYVVNNEQFYKVTEKKHKYNVREGKRKDNIEANNCMQKGIIETGIKLFNKLPCYLQEKKNDKEFLTLLKEFLMKGCYYTVNEYIIE